MWDEVSSVFSIALLIIFIVAGILAKADPQGLGKWLLFHDPRPRMRWFVRASIALLVLGSFALALWATR